MSIPFRTEPELAVEAPQLLFDAPFVPFQVVLNWFEELKAKVGN